MGYWNLDGVWTCECMCSECEDSYFCDPPRRSIIFNPPQLRNFLLELISDLPEPPGVKAAQEREERARNRAEPTNVALDIGTKQARPKFRPARVQEGAVGMI